MKSAVSISLLIHLKEQKYRFDEEENEEEQGKIDDRAAIVQNTLPRSTGSIFRVTKHCNYDNCDWKKIDSRKWARNLKGV